ncbi:hypothetical protein J4Q44_G00384770 [Coregonus suidteri]|uniref:Uncharacterized protein n=1 Tax=Coregonus suidteri TaxID=861788 RepID=A0AAN8Q4P7_9TELE
MAAVEKAHVENSVEILEEDSEPQEDHNAESDDSDRGSDGEGSEDGGSDGEGSEDGEEEDGESDGEQAEDGGSEGEKEEGEGNKEVDDVDTNPNAGWAEAMAKILQKKTPESKPSILLKNKQLGQDEGGRRKKEYLERKKQDNGL